MKAKNQTTFEGHRDCFPLLFCQAIFFHKVNKAFTTYRTKKKVDRCAGDYFSKLLTLAQVNNE